MSNPRYETRSGRPLPLGASPDAEGINFSIFSDHATRVELLLFERHDDPEPIQTITLDPARHKTFHFWHVYVAGFRPGALYAYRMDGPQDLHGAGHRYNPRKVLLDPYSKANMNTLWKRVDAVGPNDNLATSMRSMVIDIAGYDWEGDRPIGRALTASVIYEMHVRGFTQHPSSGCRNPGTFLGVIEKIPYLQELGITAIELLPVFDWDETEVLRRNPIDDSALTNYWGYDPYGFFAPQCAYCVSPHIGRHIDEFRDMVKALHKAGIEVILDVVFNHTGEGNHRGPTISFRGIDNGIFYHLSPSDRQYYMDYTGTGNSLNCNHPLTQKFIIDCLEFWVKEMHVDGFRFDLASVFTRGLDGQPMENAPVVWAIELSEMLAETKVIAEAWDIGVFQVGRFPGLRWAEWNGTYRDEIRSFVKGDPGLVGRVAYRIAGSADIFEVGGELPMNSINFITCHDGFTLNDLVSYNEKHNEANGEGNRDGNNHNLSWNCGFEGETDDPAIEELRQRQIRNSAAILLLSQGVPMLLAGDEVRHTQRGNNNAYCQDNELSWLDWDLLSKNADIFRFFSKMIAFRKSHPSLRRARYLTGELTERGLADVSWHGSKLESPGWNDPNSKVLAFTLAGLSADEEDIHAMLNMDSADLAFDVPPLDGRNWFRVVDTSLPSPTDFVEAEEEVRVSDGVYQLKARSVAILVSKPSTSRTRRRARASRRASGDDSTAT